ncbi:5561_t:CDS:2, partial [Racocetra persica]
LQNPNQNNEKENVDPTSKELEKKKKRKKTELEVLSNIPPSIHYPKLDKSTSTTKASTARTPFPVMSWTSFIEEVRSHQFNNTHRRYPPPLFKKYNKTYDISNEEDVRCALKNNILDNLNIITSSQQPVEVYKRISKEDNVSGGPDFIYKRVGRLLLEVEVKTLWVLNIKDN